MCVQTLGGYVNGNENIQPEVKIAAIKVLLERGWGRPSQQIEHTGKDGENEIQIVMRTITEGRK